MSPIWKTIICAITANMFFDKFSDVPADPTLLDTTIYVVIPLLFGGGFLVASFVFAFKRDET